MVVIGSGSVIILNKSSKRLSTSTFILMGLLFVFSMLSIAFSFSSLLKNIVYAAGFLIAIVLIIFIKFKINRNEITAIECVK